MSSSDSSFSSSLAAGASASAAPPAAAGAAPPAAAPPPEPPEGTEASFSDPEAMSSLMSLPSSSEMSLFRRSSSASIPTALRTACGVLDWQLEWPGESPYLDVVGRRRGVSTKTEEEVGCEVLHCDGELVVSVARNRSSIDLTCACQYCVAAHQIARRTHRLWPETETSSSRVVVGRKVRGPGILTLGGISLPSHAAHGLASDARIVT